MKSSRPLTFFPISPHLLLLFVFLLALGLRLYKLGFQSFWHDEFCYVKFAAAPGVHFGFSRLLSPVYVAVMKVWFLLFPVSEVSARIPGALFGALTIPAFYLLGKELFNVRVALWASFFLAVSTIHIDYCQEAKYTALLLLITILLQWLFIRILKYGQSRDFIWYTAACLVGIYTHYFIFSLLLIQDIFVFLFYKRFKTAIKGVFIAQWIATILFLPCVFYISYHLHGFSNTISSLSWLPEPTLDYILETTVTLFSDGFSFINYGHLARVDLRFALEWYYIFGGLIILLLIRCRANMKTASPFLLLIFLWIILPTVLFVFWSKVVSKVYHVRYILMTIFALYLLYGWFMENEKAKFFRASFLALFLLLNTANLIFYFNNPIRTQMREAAQFITQHIRNDETVAVKGYSHEYALFNYYFHKTDLANMIAFNEKDYPFDPSPYDWVVAVYPTKIDTERYPFQMHYLFGIHLYHRINTIQ